MTVIKTIMKTVTTRAWHDVEPKVLAFLASGLTATLLISAANYIGVKISPDIASVAVVIIGSIAGYFKSSTAKVDVPTAVVTDANIPTPVAVSAADVPATIGAPVILDAVTPDVPGVAA